MVRRYCFLTHFMLTFGLIGCQTTASTEHLSAKTKAIRDFLSLCTSVTMCTVPEPQGRLKLTCCNPCDCSDQCGYDCCPDGPQTYMTEHQIVLLKRNDILKCTKPSINKDVLSNNWPMYEMIVGCPYEYTNETIKEKCLRPFKEFDLDDHVWNIPVTINTTRMTYKNLYCAMCNDARIEDSVTWDVNLRCYKIFVHERVNVLEHYNVTSMDDIPNNIPDICNVLFRVPALTELPSHSDGVTECPGTIDRCNVTGQWAGLLEPYDFHVESACLSYRSEYGGYRNIHCYLCNGGNFSDIDAGCSRNFDTASSVDTTLIVKNAIKITGQECDFGYVFDNSTETCRRLLCSKGFVYDGVQCVPFIQYQHDEYVYHVYDVTLTFEPDRSSLTNKISLTRIVDLWDAYAAEHLSKLYENTGAENVEICDNLRFIKFKQSPNDLLSTLQRESRDALFFDVMYVAFTLRISITNVNNLSQAILDLLPLYNSSDISVKVNSFKPGLRIVDPSLIDTVFQPRQNTHVVDEDLLRSSGLLYFMEDTLRQSHIDPSDSLAIAPISGSFKNEECESVASVDVNAFCPKIELNSDEFAVAGSGVRIKRIDRHVNRDNGHFGSGMTTFRMCSELYVKLVQDGLDAITSCSTAMAASYSLACDFIIVALLYSIGGYRIVG